MVVCASAIAGTRHVQIEASQENAESSIGSISRLEWTNEAVPLEEKLDIFFSRVEATYATLAAEANAELAGLLVLIVMMSRLILATAVHPRVGLLPTTLKNGFDDLLHFAIIFMLLYLLFALLGTWILGASRADFADFQTSCATQLDMMLGGLPEDWSEETNVLVFVTIHFVVFFFFLLNFLLAIIVEAYSMRSHKVFK